ncbi:MAG: DUF2344 domain-containing protein [Leptolinea sp.]|jgi:radical SAM-linked protein|nr:DUF2344 domain-containing protein [Leptolinea sp.]
MGKTPSSQSNPQPVLTRVRVTFAKSGALIYTGALDLQKIWERVLRRARLPLAYTQGFSPGPRINLASALPLGVSGERELADFWFTAPPDMDTFCGQVNRAAPPGLRALSSEVMPLSSPALQTRVEAAEYHAGPLSPQEYAAAVAGTARVLSADSLPRERRGKPYDLRPLILEITMLPDVAGGGTIRMTLKAREGATGRADEVLAELGLAPDAVPLARTGIILKPETPVVK